MLADETKSSIMPIKAYLSYVAETSYLTDQKIYLITIDMQGDLLKIIVADHMPQIKFPQGLDVKYTYS